MFILNLIFYFLGRFAFRIVFVLFGWAVGIFMGKTNARENIRIYSFTGISLLWAYTAVYGMIFGGRHFLGFLPDSEPMRIISRVILTSGIFIFPVIGGIFICGKKERLTHYALSGLKGFFYCPIMAGAFVLMMIFGIIIIVRRLLTKEEALFLEFRSPMPEKKLKAEIMRVLGDFGGAEEEKAPLIYSLPNKIFSLVREGDVFLKRETFLKGRDLRIFVNKDDLMIEGCKTKCHAVKIKLTKCFMSEEIYFAKGKECVKIEEKILNAYRRWQKGLAGADESLTLMESMKTDMETALFEDWEILRLRLSVCKESISEKGERNAQEKNRGILRKK